MLSIATDKKLSILLPNTNKALAKVLKSATLDELSSITQNKDLKSVLNSLLKDSSLNSSADKALLSLVKNNPTLKEIANIKEPMKELINTLKSEKPLENIAKDIQKFLPNIKEIQTTNIKSTLQNSGVFLESKLKDIQNPQVKLSDTLNTLTKLIQKSDLPKAPIIQNTIDDILKSPTFKEIAKELVKESSKAQESVVKSVQRLVKDLSAEIKNANPITTLAFDKKIQKLESLLEPKIITDTKIQLTEKNQLPVQTKTPELKLPEIVQAIKDVNTTLQTSFTNNSKSSMDSLTKILELIKTMKDTSPNAKVAIGQIIQKDIPLKIDKILTDIKTEIKRMDIVFSKETRNILKELSLLNAPQKLSTTENIKEIISNDLKVVLHKAGEEIAKLNPSQNLNDALKQIDKLNLAIDYHQLVSHLSNSSSLYLPVTWDEMQEGSISIKKTKEDKFYCDIELSLKEYKELRVRLSLYDKNQLNIHISSDSSKLKQIMGESMSELRNALIGSNIQPRDIRFSSYTKASQGSHYNDVSKDVNMGFEVKA